MSEKNYSVDEILAEAGRGGKKRSSSGISEKANRQAMEILQSVAKVILWVPESQRLISVSVLPISRAKSFCDIPFSSRIS